MQQLDELPAKVQGLYSQDPSVQYEATQWFRKLLSIGKHVTDLSVRRSRFAQEHASAESMASHSA